MTKLDIIINLKSYINKQIHTLASTSPIVSFAKPLITRALDKNIDKLDSFLELLTDKEGNIDIENILSEMVNNVMITDPFIFNAPVVGDMEIGGGAIKINLPFIDKRLVLNKADLDILKEVLTTNY